MSDRRCLEKVDELCRDIFGVPDVPFGGLVVLASGDLRQTLPVVKRGSRAAVIAATIVSSHLWPLLTKHRLSDNMRVLRLRRDGDDQLAQQLQVYADWLLSVGDGTSGKILRIPPTMLLPPRNRNLGGLIRYVFGDLTADGALLADRLMGRVIMTPLNKHAEEINHSVMKLLPTAGQICYSADSITDSPGFRDASVEFPIEWLNSLDIAGLPPHVLNLKIGAIVMLLRNMNRKQGLMNGTRLQITAIQPRVLRATLLTGAQRGTTVLLPRISLTPSDTNLPFDFTRRQFPVKIAWGITINKGQGQTYDVVGIFLPQPVFSHGQAYVAASRSGDPNKIAFLIEHDSLAEDEVKGEHTANVVYSEVFTRASR